MFGETKNAGVYDFESDQVIPLKDYLAKIGLDTSAVPESAEYAGEFKNGKIVGEFKNSLKWTGKFELWKGYREPGAPHLPTPRIEGPLTWEDFKQRVGSLKNRGALLFRGQHSNNQALQTSFHRAGRNDLLKYVQEDVPRLRHRVNAFSSHIYGHSGEDFIALLSLGQHHGFPTPLLDWTRSPYVAAFFAFDLLSYQSNRSELPNRPPVSIYVFDLEKWSSQRPRSLKDPHPSLDFLEPAAHNNPRFYPQQSVAMYTNINDIEGYIGIQERRDHTCYLTRYDVHFGELIRAEEDLRWMGVTASNLFPGFEGICKSLRAERF